MKTTALQRKLDHLARINPLRFSRIASGLDFGGRLKGLGTSALEIETVRAKIGGRFGHRTGRRFFDRGRTLWEPTSDWAFSPNIVTNEGLAYVIDVAFREVADIAPWYVVLFNTNTTPLATHTYASPGYTECDGTDLDETVRQAWVDGSPTGTTTRTVAGSAVTYTGDASFTAYGAALVGGGTAATTLANTAGGGTLYASSLFSSSIAMTLDATVDVTYSLTAADDGA